MSGLAKLIHSGLTNTTKGVWLTQARLLGYSNPQQLLIDAQGQIQRIESLHPLTGWTGTVIDLEGDWLSLGGVDLQINGGLGLPFPEVTVANLEKLTPIAQWLWQQGVDGFLPTIVTSPIHRIQAALAAFAQVIDHQVTPQAAQILGVHLEGPFLNPDKRGAHAQEHLLPLSVEQVKRVLGDYASVVKVITLAPELDPSGDAIAYLRSLGITVSLGHSLATAAEAQRAFDQGATMVTHAFNAMPGLHHRQPGLLGAAIVDPRVWYGLIADGEHVSPLMLEILLRTQRPGGGCFLVSDALAPLGLGDGFYPWDDRQMQVIHGTARLSDGTLCGTTLPLLTGVANLVEWGICALPEAIALAVDAPRQAISLQSPTLTPGQSARDLLRWRQDRSSGTVSWQRFLAASHHEA